MNQGCKNRGTLAEFGFCTDSFLIMTKNFVEKDTCLINISSDSFVDFTPYVNLESYGISMTL